MKPKPTLPLIDVEKFVPAAITVVRRSRGWPGLFLQERRGGSGEVHYLPGNRQHVFYCFLQPMTSEVTSETGVHLMSYETGEGRFSPAGRPVVFRWSGDVRVLMLGFEPWFLQGIAAELGTSGAMNLDANSRKLPSEHRACILVQQLAAEFDAAAGSPLIAEGVARAIAVLLLREFDRIPAPKLSQPAPPAAVLRAVAVMRSRLAEPLSLDELAQVAALSPFHFARQFKTATGHPPHEYLIRLRSIARRNSCAKKDANGPWRPSPRKAGLPIRAIWRVTSSGCLGSPHGYSPTRTYGKGGRALNKSRPFFERIASPAD